MATAQQVVPGAHTTVKVPATTANLGPGFDCLGLALDIWDEVTLTAGASGRPPAETSDDHQYGELVLLAARRYYEEAGMAAPDLAVSLKRSIPLGRGLGSSAAAIVAGCLGANRLAGDPLSLEAVGRLAAAIEGHPDNSTPCLFGGFQVCVVADDTVVRQQVPFPSGLSAVLFIPDFPMPTHETRKLLPVSLSRSDVVFQISRTALLVASMATGNLGHLTIATQDRLHQPARGQVFTGMWALFDAALGAGAACAYLSGGGPTVLALTQSNGETVRDAFEAVARAQGIAGETRITRPVEHGAYVLD